MNGPGSIDDKDGNSHISTTSTIYISVTYS